MLNVVKSFSTSTDMIMHFVPLPFCNEGSYVFTWLILKFLLLLHNVNTLHILYSGEIQFKFFIQV